ncbi:MAG: XTP/dITP diphosphatase [Syntrophales bacterium]
MSKLKAIVLASRNQGKIKEIQAMLASYGINFCSLNDYPKIPEIVEDGMSFLENALKKGRTVAEATGEIVLADDSGLEVEALGGAPGIYSARYAGNDADDLQNNRKLLDDLKGVPAANRSAVFRCVLVLYPPDGRYEAFEGRWEGRITEAPAGEGGFGYDPLFFLPGEGMTVAQLSPEVKNTISHRANAFAKLKERLKNFT